MSTPNAEASALITEKQPECPGDKKSVGPPGGPANICSVGYALIEESCLNKKPPVIDAYAKSGTFTFDYWEIECKTEIEKKKVVEWTTLEVGIWIASHGPAYIDVARACVRLAVNGRVLAGVTSGTLREVMTGIQAAVVNTNIEQLVKSQRASEQAKEANAPDSLRR